MEESTHRALRAQASEQGMSMAGLIRLILQAHLGIQGTPKRLEDFPFVGSGRSRPSSIDPISERHDEALAEDFAR